MSYEILSGEMSGNPGLYAAMTDAEIVIELNVVDKVQNRISMTRQEIYENIDSTALSALSSVQLSQLNLALSDTVDPFGNAAQVFIDVFGGGSATILALQAARIETVSRTMQLGIPTVKIGQVMEARA